MFFLRNCNPVYEQKLIMLICGIRDKLWLQWDIYNYSCGLSTATIEYSSLSVCLSVCLCTR